MNKIFAVSFLASACFAAVAPPAARAAYYYEATTTIEGSGAGRGGQVSTVQAWVDGGNARIELQEGNAGGFLEAGTYLLTNDGGGTLYVVDPAKETVSEINLAQIFQMVGTMSEAMGGMVQMEFTDFVSEKTAEGPGEAVLGYPTTRQRFNTGYTMRIGVLGMRRENRVDTEHDLLCTDAFDAAGFSVWLRPDRFRTGNEDMDRLIEQQFAVDCLPLRNRAVTTMTGQRGRESTTTTVTEVTTLREEAAPADAFVLPAGFTMTPLIPDFSELSGGGSDGDAAGAEQQRDEPARRPRLRDLIGR